MPRHSGNGRIRSSFSVIIFDPVFPAVQGEAVAGAELLSMLDLVKEYEAGKINYVYSFNETTKCIEPKPILKAWRTKQNAELVKISL